MMMWDWPIKNPEAATALFTLAAALATLLAVLVTAWIGFWTIRHNTKLAAAQNQLNAGLTSTQLQRNTDLVAAQWIFDAHMKLHSDKRLMDIFFAVKYGTYNFICEAPGTIELNTPKEAQLVLYLDFLNSVDAAIKKKTITPKDLDETTIGFAIKMANKSQPINQYRAFIKRRDQELDLEVKAWGAMDAASS
jgi:RNase H-fold protein (predicted Holliday junction resolvase)